MTDDIKMKMNLKNKFYGQYIRPQRKISDLLKNNDICSEVAKLIASLQILRKNTINLLTQN